MVYIAIIEPLNYIVMLSMFTVLPGMICYKIYKSRSKNKNVSRSKKPVGMFAVNSRKTRIGENAQRDLARSAARRARLRRSTTSIDVSIAKIRSVG